MGRDIYMLSKTKEATKRSEQLLQERAASLEQLNTLLAEDQQAINAAEAAIKAATMSDDLQAFRAAKNDLSAAQDALEMHTKRRTVLENGPLITDEEYNKLVSDMIAEIKTIERKTQKRLVSLADQMAEAGQALQDSQQAVNTALRRLQHDIYRDADRTRRNGQIILIASEDKQVDTWETINWSKAPLENDVYKRCKGAEDE